MKPITVLMSGISEGVTEDPIDGNKDVHSFIQRVPIPSYLIAIVAGDIVSRYTNNCRALTRILKTGVRDSHLAKSRSPTGKSGSPTPKNLESHQLCIPLIFSILAGNDIDR